MFLRRGEIVVANLGRDARGWEIGNKQEDGGPVRPAVVVSSYFSNQNRLRATVVPVTNYKNIGKELKVNWGFPISRESVQNCSLKYDESFVDCGQLVTLFAVPNNHSLSGKVPSDIDFNQRCGKLRDRLRIDLALQIVCNEELIIPSMFWKQRFGTTPMQGDIVAAELPSSQVTPTGQPQLALVVSASAVDGIRNTIPLGHITVVALENISAWNVNYNYGVCPVTVRGLETEQWMANCQEVYTVDWKKRNTQIVGHIKDAENMARAMRALRQYLDLPAQGLSHGIVA